MIKFKELKFDDISETHGKDAVQSYMELGNGFDVSIVKHQGSYGNEKGLYEIGVFDAQRYGIDAMCDPLDWGDTVKGWLDEEEVESIIKQLQEL